MKQYKVKVTITYAAYEDFEDYSFIEEGSSINEVKERVASMFNRGVRNISIVEIEK